MFTQLFLEAVQAGTWVWTVDTDTVTWSSNMEPLHGLLPNTFRGTLAAFLELVHPDDRSNAMNAIQDVVVRGDGRFQIDYRVRRDVGSMRWIGARAQVLAATSDEPRRMIGICMDITDQKLGEQALRESEAWLRQAIGAMTVGVYTTDRDGYIQQYNEEAAKLWGRKPNLLSDTLEQFCGSWEIYLPDGAHVPIEDCPMAQVLPGAEPIRNSEVIFERPDGSRRTVLVNPSPIRDDAGQLIGAINCMIDITERKQVAQQLAERTAEAEKRATQLRRTAVGLTRAEQREREKLAAMLHDDLQQLLAGTKMLAKSLKRKDAAGLPTAVDQVVALLDEAIDSARSLSHQLHPHFLSHGLAKALKWLSSQQEKKTGFKLHVEVEERAEPDSKDVRAMLFHCVRELLLNVVKHGQANEASVRLRLDEQNRLELLVEDQGRGFDTCASMIHNGIGLFSIRERLAMLGGEMNIESQPNCGTRVTLVLSARAAVGTT